jgi:hypothetical protein
MHKVAGQTKPSISKTDAFQTSTFETLLEREEAHRNDLHGFTFLPETAAAFSMTGMRMPQCSRV